MFKKYVLFALALSVLISLIVMPKSGFVSLANSPSSPYELIVETIPGGGPVTVEPANCYDTASLELVFNVYETLIFFDGERYDVFIPMLATQVWIAPPDPTAPAYTNYTVYFKIRTSVPFHNWSRTDEPFSWAQYHLTTDDVEYSFERWMVHDYVDGPQWMMFEPLLDCYVADISDPDFGTKIDDAVQSNETHVWLNIANKGLVPRTETPTFTPIGMFDVEDGRFSSTFWDDVAYLPLGYAPRIFFQVISQSWASILSKPWIIDFVNSWLEGHGLSNMTDWDGDFTNWINYTGWEESPLDKIGATYPAVTCGTGPYILDRYNLTDYVGEWSAVKFDDYWRGWPARWPSPPYPPQMSSGIKPEGWVERLTVKQADTTKRIEDLIAGECDFAAIPRSRVFDLHVGQNINGPTLAGIRLNYPIPSLSVQSMHYTFDIEPTPNNTYGKINDYNVLTADGIPRNFFADIHVRKAFTHLINFTLPIHEWFFDEAYQPSTCAPAGLPYVNPSQSKYGPDTDVANAKTEFDQAFGGSLAMTGFSVTLAVNVGSGVKSLSQHLAYMINQISTQYYGGRFHAQVCYVSWSDYIRDMEAHKLPIFFLGWLADYADINNYVYAYLHSQGLFGAFQRYNNVEADDLIDKGLRTPDGPLRQAIYHRLQEIYYDDVPSVTLYVSLGRSYIRTWVNGFYHNPVYPGVYAYTIWKWEYTYGNVNYDNKVSMDDIITIIDAFGSYASKQGSLTYHQRWNFHADVDGIPFDSWRDRKIDMGDIVTAVTNFGKTDETWQPPP